MNFMRIGEHIVNLDRVTWADWVRGHTDRLDIHFGPDPMQALSISGGEAKEAWGILCRLANKQS